jgi:hypothetical protein
MDSQKYTQKRDKMLKDAMNTTRRLQRCIRLSVHLISIRFSVVDHSIVILKQIQRDFGYENHPNGKDPNYEPSIDLSRVH